MPVGCKITVTYAPDNTILTPDPAAGVWGDALDAWVQAYIADGVVTPLGPNGMYDSGQCDYIKNSEGASDPVIRISLIWSSGIQTPFDLVAFQTALGNMSSDTAAMAAMDVFDSVGSVTLVGTYVEQWSDVTT